MERSPVKAIYLVLGWIALALGGIGAFLPVLPTTPFILLAAFCFSKGSRRTHEWLLENPLFGKMIRDWERYGAIGIRAKCVATLMLVLSFASIWAFARVGTPLKGALTLVGTGVLVYLWTRPSPKSESGR